MKNTIYAEEYGFGLQAEVVGNCLRLSIMRLGNSPNDAEEVASATIANYRVKQTLLPIVESVAGAKSEAKAEQQ